MKFDTGMSTNFLGLPPHPEVLAAYAPHAGDLRTEASLCHHTEAGYRTTQPKRLIWERGMCSPSMRQKMSNLAADTQIEVVTICDLNLFKWEP